ncbi:MAG: hypothetical protein R3A52_18470 [Polyangiales bacterium]
MACRQGASAAHGKAVAELARARWPRRRRCLDEVTAATRAALDCAAGRAGGDGGVERGLRRPRARRGAGVSSPKALVASEGPRGALFALSDAAAARARRASSEGE